MREWIVRRTRPTSHDQKVSPTQKAPLIAARIDPQRLVFASSYPGSCRLHRHSSCGTCASLSLRTLSVCPLRMQSRLCAQIFSKKRTLSMAVRRNLSHTEVVVDLYGSGSSCWNFWNFLFQDHFAHDGILIPWYSRNIPKFESRFVLLYLYIYIFIEVDCFMRTLCVYLQCRYVRLATSSASMHTCDVMGIKPDVRWRKFEDGRGADPLYVNITYVLYDVESMGASAL
jgi:hypothetical protein